MGTNYYAIPKDLDVDDRLYMINEEYLKEGLIDEAIAELDELNQLKKGIHIGKKSCGWQFIFDHNDWKYFGESKEEFLEWLKEQDIKDEYGQDVNYDEILGMVKSSAHEWNMEKYYSEMHPNSRELRIPDLYLDDLLFSAGSNFS